MFAEMALAVSDLTTTSSPFRGNAGWLPGSMSPQFGSARLSQGSASHDDFINEALGILAFYSIGYAHKWYKHFTRRHSTS